MADIFKKIGFVNGQTKANANTMNTLETNISNAIQTVLLAAHPIGSYYWSSNNTNPSSLFGGTWIQVKDKFVLAAGDSYIAGNTGGEARHTLTIDEMPSHNHRDNADLWANSSPTSGASGTYNNIVRTNAGNYMTTATAGGGARVDLYTSYTGNSQSHNNMPPYEVAYCWKRTA